MPRQRILTFFSYTVITDVICGQKTITNVSLDRDNPIAKSVSSL